MPNIVAIIPAAGSGSRMAETLPKQYLALNGIPMIFHTLMAFAAVTRITKIVVVLSPDDKYWDTLFVEHGATIANRVTAIRVGGATRALSVLNSLQEISDQFAIDDWALVHDAARPCIRPRLIEQFLDECALEKVGGLLALPVADTLKLGNSDLRVERTIPRDNLWRAQTPQMFRFNMLIEALARMPNATDEAQAIEALGHQPKLINGDSANLKVTYATDVRIAEVLLSREP